MQNKKGNVKGIVFDIKKFAIHDGPGIRTTVFLKGCPLRCWWCHNPEGFKTELQTTIESDVDNKQKKETVGKNITVNEVINEIEKDIIFFDESCGGVTFSGGEPFLQYDFLHSMIHECKERGIHTAVDTSGHAPKEKIAMLHPYVNLFLYDLKFIDDSLHLKYTGVSNKQILNNLKYLCENGKQVIIRIPIIPGITDAKTNLTQLAEYISSLKNINSVDILPFHNTGKEKFKRLGLEYKMDNTQQPEKESMNRIKKYFEKYGFRVKIGG